MRIEGFPNVWEVDETSYSAWIEKSELEFTENIAPCESFCFSIVMPVFNTPLEFLRAAIDSVISQTHANWHLCIANDASTDTTVWLELEKYRDLDSRVRLVSLAENAGIASASNQALTLATGDYVVLMDHDDVIPAHALQTVANVLKEDPGIKFLYSDSDHLDENGKRCKPFFKPDWDYIRFLGQNYLNHLTVVQHSLLQSIGGWRQGYEGSQDYDLFLRIVEHIEQGEIKHVPQVLYHWRVVPHSVSRSSLGRAVKAARQAIRDHLVRIGIAANLKPAGKAIIYNRVEWPPPRSSKRVILLVYGQYIAEVKQLIEDTNSRSDVFHSEILEFDHTEAGFKISAILTKLLREGHHDLIGLYNSNLVPENDSWLQSLGSMASMATFGLVGAKIIAGNGTLYGGPVFSDRRSSLYAQTGGTTISHQATEESRGYIANLLLDQTVTRLTPGFVMFRREVLDDCRASARGAGGVESVVDDLCQRAIEGGFRNAWSSSVVFRERGAGPNDQLGYSVGAEEISAGSTNTDLMPPFLYPNPSFNSINWRIRWSRYS